MCHGLDLPLTFLFYIDQSHCRKAAMGHKVRIILWAKGHVSCVENAQKEDQAMINSQVMISA